MLKEFLPVVCRLCATKKQQTMAVFLLKKKVSQTSSKQKKNRKHRKHRRKLKKDSNPITEHFFFQKYFPVFVSLPFVLCFFLFFFFAMDILDICKLSSLEHTKSIICGKQL